MAKQELTQEILKKKILTGFGTVKNFRESTGLGNDFIYCIFNRSNYPRLDTAAIFCGALGIKLEELEAYLSA